MIGRPIGENHGEQCANDDPHWWCDDCRAGLRNDLGDLPDEEELDS